MKDTIQLNMYDVEFTANVIDAYYKIDQTGQLSVCYRTDMDHYIKQIEKDLGYNLVRVLRPANEFLDICAGDEVKLVFNENESDKILSIYLQKKATPKPGHSRISFDLNIEKCPVCGSVLTLDKYCLNDNCQAKLMYSIRKFLQIATTEEWRLEEILLFDKLVTVGKLKHIADIYKVTQEQVNSLGVWFSKTERYVGFGVCDKIARTRGTVTLYNYLQSLNIPRSENWFIDKDLLEKKFSDIGEFLIGMFEDNSKPNNKTLRACMNEDTYATLYTYFSSDKAIDNVKRLIDEDVFDS